MYCIIRRNPKTCKDIIDSDDELPTEIDEIPFIPAYLRDNRFDDTDETVELDFLSTATDDSPDQQLNVPSEVRSSVDARVTRPKTWQDMIDSNDKLPTDIDEILPFVTDFLRYNELDDAEKETVEIDFLSTDGSPDQQLNVPAEVRSSVAEINEIPFIPAFLRGIRFEDTEKETVEIDFLSTATDDSPDQQLNVPSEVRSSLDSRVTRPMACQDIIDSDDELPTEIDEIPFIPAYLGDNRFDDTEKEAVELAEIDEIPFIPVFLRGIRFEDTEKETVEIDFLCIATDGRPDQQLNVPAEVRSSVESLSSLTAYDSSDQSSCWCDSPCEVRSSRLAENIESPSDPADLMDNRFDDTENEIKGFEFLTTNDSSDQQFNVPSEVGTSRSWVFGSKVEAVGVFKFGTSVLEPKSELESEVVEDE